MLDAVRYELTHDRQEGAQASTRKARAKLSGNGRAGTATPIERRSQFQVEVCRHVLPPIVLLTLVPRHPQRQSVEATRLEHQISDPAAPALDEKGLSLLLEAIGVQSTASETSAPKHGPRYRKTRCPYPRSSPSD